jgi:F0F1-type ATP synthase assembly protein I
MSSSSRKRTKSDNENKKDVNVNDATTHAHSTRVTANDDDNNGEKEEVEDEAVRKAKKLMSNVLVGCPRVLGEIHDYLKNADEVSFKEVPPTTINP